VRGQIEQIKQLDDEGMTQHASLHVDFVADSEHPLNVVDPAAAG